MHLKTTLPVAIRSKQNLTANEKPFYSELTDHTENNKLYSLSDYGLVTVIKAKLRLLKISLNLTEFDNFLINALKDKPLIQQQKPSPSINPQTFGRPQGSPVAFKASQMADHKENYHKVNDNKVNYIKTNFIKANDNKADAILILEHKANFTLNFDLLTELKANFKKQVIISSNLVKFRVKKLGLTKLLYPLSTKLLTEISNAIVRFFTRLWSKEANSTASLDRV